MKIFVFVFMMTNLTSVYCAAVLEDPVNVQEIDLKYVDDIIISYRSEKVVLYKNNSDSLIIKEYMSRDNSDYYAKITNSQNKLIVEAGRRPRYFFFGRFTARIEIYIPESDKNITVKTSSGKIEGNDKYGASSISVESTSGSISVNSVTANTVNFRASSGSIRCKEINGNAGVHTYSGSIVLGDISGDILAEATSGSIELNSVDGAADLRTSSGSIRCKKINGNTGVHTYSGSIVLGDISGNVLAEATSGGIRLDSVNGAADVKTSSGSIHCTVIEDAGDVSITSSSGSIHCTVTENAENISIKSSSGSVSLSIPNDFAFNFSSRTSSGSLRTPFSDKLFSPITDKNFAQGLINGAKTSESQDPRDINIRTTSGSIRVNWVN